MMDHGVEASGLQEELFTIEDQISRITEQVTTLNKQLKNLQNRRKETETRLNAIRLEALANSSNQHFSSYDSEEGFAWSTEVNRLRRELFCIKHFRHLQIKAINATMDGKDVILVMPTGGGKSLTYQLPAMLSTNWRSCPTGRDDLPSFTLVISPLLSLMHDQKMNLGRLGIKPDTVVVFDGSTSVSDQTHYLNIISGKNKPGNSSTDYLRLLYVTPEKLVKSKRLLNRLEVAYSTNRLSRIVIDEVHCVSQWGHDFRPDYRMLHILRRQFPNVPLLGLTATASAEVIVDIQSMLNISPERCLVLRSGYNRDNLDYEVQSMTGTIKNSSEYLHRMIQTRYPGQSGIIYCFSQKDTEQLADSLQKLGTKAVCYHANLDAEFRSKVHTSWHSGKIQVIVATVAFGMGIDKPDVRFVLHYSMSKSLENYYQESGRAGRDGEPADAVLIWRFADLFRLASLVSTERTGVAKLLSMLAYCIEPAACRRQLIARQLASTAGEDGWKPSDCSLACDNCRLTPGVTDLTAESTSQLYRINVTGLVVALSDLLTRTESRVTGPKLVDLLRTAVTKPAGVICSEDSETTLGFLTETGQRLLPKPFYEHFIAWCLVRHLLQMDFHFTPYSTVCYLVTTDKMSTATCIWVMPYRHRLEQNMKRTKYPSSTSTSHPSKHPKHHDTLTTD